MMFCNNDDINNWIINMVSLLQPKNVHICNGSDTEYQNFCDQMVLEKRMVKLNEAIYTNCYLCLSDPNDVARSEDRTFICTTNKRDAGPTNNWENPLIMKKKLRALYSNCMIGRTMYIIPFCMGHVDSPLSQIGIQLTDSLYVALSMKIMTHIVNIDFAVKRDRIVRCIHSVGYPLHNNALDVVWPYNEDKYICHFPESLEISSYGSGYGGNALLGKKCLALRIASYIGQQEGWLAEHMLISKITNPEGKYIYIVAAFPSSCGKTNLAMLRSILVGWKVECLGDDIAWLKIGKDDRLYAINPENGFFGILPGTSDQTNPTVMKMIKRNTIFTNVGLTPDLDVWWEGKTSHPPDGTITWLNKIYDGTTKVAHPNSRFTTPLVECDILAHETYNPNGVPISAILFGGRRCDTIPLVTQAKNYRDGVFYGVSLSSETTAAATGRVGIIRNDPFAMLPFCGYNMGDYFNHWLKIGEKIKDVKFFSVNWFRKNNLGEFIWPGFEKNIYVLKWIFNKCINHYSVSDTNSITFTPQELYEIYGDNVPQTINKILHFDNVDQICEYDRMTKYLEIFDSNIRFDPFGDTFLAQ